MLKRIFTLTICTILLVCLSVSTAFASGRQNEETIFPAGANVERMKEIIKPGYDQVLKADPSNEIVLDKVEVKARENGISIEASGSASNLDKPLAYKIKIDPEKGTYKTLKCLIPLEKPEQFKAQSVDYEANVKIATYDPAEYQLCASRLRLGWRDYGSYIGHRFHNLYTWDANPTPLNTHWYLDYTNLPNPTISYDNQVIWQTGFAQHYNYDFGIGSQITTVGHYMQITAINNSYRDFDYDWQSFKDGEAWWLLHDHLIIY